MKLFLLTLAAGAVLLPASAQLAETPEERQAQCIAQVTEASEKAGSPEAASPPSVIAKEISKAIHANRPKTRYAAGKMAKPLLFIRRYFSDRIFDKAIMSQVN